MTPRIIAEPVKCRRKTKPMSTIADYSIQTDGPMSMNFEIVVAEKQQIGYSPGLILQYVIKDV